VEYGLQSSLNSIFNENPKCMFSGGSSGKIRTETIIEEGNEKQR